MNNFLIKLKNLFRSISGFNTSILTVDELGRNNSNKRVESRSGGISMQIPIPPGQIGAALAGLIYGLSLAGKTVVYTLSLGKALIVAGTTASIIRPGIPFRAIKATEKFLAQIIGYRELTPISDERVANLLSGFLMRKLVEVLSSPAGIAILVGASSYLGVTVVKNWVESLVQERKRSEAYLEGQGEKPLIPYLDGGSQIVEENRQLRLKVKRLEQTRSRRILP
jgi:hypothetical protein